MTQNSPSQTDYASIDVPERPEADDEDPADWHYTKRRAWLYHAVIERGGTQRISRTKTGERFDKNPSTITRDLKAVEDYIANTMDETSFFATVKAHFEKRYSKLMKAGEEDKAWDLLMSYGSMLQKKGVIEDVDKKEVAIDSSGIEINFDEVERNDEEVE